MPSSDSVKVAVRVRPFSQRENNAGSKCVISMNSNTTSIHDPKNPSNVKTFTFDLAYWSHSGFIKDQDGKLISADPSSKYAGQREVFHDLGEGVLDSAWQGYNATLLAYGPTGSGKSYSMIGYGANRGIIPVVCEELFKTIQNKEKNRQYQVTFSMLEIYNEQVIDLLSKVKKPGGLKVREDQQQGFYVDGLKLVPCDSYAQIERLMEQGTKIRTTASTSMNTTSSRSHMVITLQFKQIFLKEDITKQSIINLVDLAGSERQKSSGSEGDRLREGSRVNLSLTTLGNVISALAEAAVGKKVLHVPYRDSVLTKLLQSALGGNSRTIMIAAISPADICYEETLSTLRYAERTKKIKNNAVINASPTEKLIKELKAENCNLFGFGGRGAVAGHSSLRCLLAENELRIQAIQATWEYRLEEARKEWEQQYAAVTQEGRMIEKFPYLVNINEDPQLSGVLKYVIQDGSSDIGQSSSNAITLRGLGILDKHATVTNTSGKVTVTPQDNCKVIVNGVPIVVKTKLQHLDRIILGSNNAYLYIGPPADRTNEDLSRYDYDFVQSELAAAKGFSVDKLGAGNKKGGKPDPSVLAVFHDYIKLMPLIAEANQMSVELKKDLKLELKVKNLASSDSRGYDLQKEIIVKVTHNITNQVWVWSKSKFINRKFLIEELYQHFLDGEDVQVDNESDPFWDPVEVLHLGSAHIWLQSLAYCMKLEEQIELLNSEGKEEAILLINIIPCSPNGRAFGEDDMVIDPLEMLGKRIDFQIHILQCLGVKWIKEVAERGIQIGYKVYDLPHSLYTKPAWKNVNPKLEELTQFSALNTSHEFLNYLLQNALIVDLWGLQEGCAELDSSRQDMAVTPKGSIIIDNPKAEILTHTGLNTDNHVTELYQKLLKLEQETEVLRDINRALREENVLLKEKVKECQTETPGKTLKSPIKKLATKTTPSVSKDSHAVCNPRISCDAEFAKALKAFYQNMNIIRGQFLKLKHYRPPEEDNVQLLRQFAEKQSHMLKDFGDQLESSISKLKNDVALIIKKKRERIANSKQ
ncbi:PREDICTED: kinesin-like protein KIF28P [Gekko japonicus]|uniref:Kinesin-like protein KIF28P n=1 Tax=Gekko japonicus TaxID=146911 RepID=A0ABM1JR45_GEKJA|nr:PREDICTED: kinesin-like protein KIF28P [Gekko japonicus]